MREAGVESRNGWLVWMDGIRVGGWRWWSGDGWMEREDVWCVCV